MKKKKTEPLWSGRFTEATSEEVARFTASVSFDKRLAHHDIQGSKAHATMLAEQGILTSNELFEIITGLESLEREINEDRFQWEILHEDVHMNIETRLIQLIGSTGKKLHTGRSRNDQVATDIRLWLRDSIDELHKMMINLESALVNEAKKYAQLIIPGFTHLQSAQPITVGHHLLAWQSMIERDTERLIDCRKRLNFCPLGSAALAGTGYKINRERTSELLGFSGICKNSLDAVSDRDFAIEFSSFASITMIHLSRIAEELILWNSSLFQFIELPDQFCTGSSIMPQKKNPDVPELVRGKTGRIVGHLISLLILMKSQPLAYNKDNQEDKEPLFDTVDNLLDCLKLFASLIPKIHYKEENLKKAASLGFPTATDFADRLVNLGLPFRDAHTIVGRAVAIAEKKNCKLEELDLEIFQTLCPLIDQSIYENLTLSGSINSRNHPGGTAPEQVLKAASKAQESIDERIKSLISST